MGAERKRWSFPGAGWLSARLSRKMIIVLLCAAILGWLLSFQWFLGYMRSYAGDTYDQAMERARESAQQVASFLTGSQGDCSGLESYLSSRNLGCSVQDSRGTILFQFMPEAWTKPQLTVSSGASVPVGEEGGLRVYVWSEAIDRQDLSDMLGQQAFVGLTLFNLSLFSAAGVLLYLLIVSPIIGLRKTMREYSEKGSLPPRSPRTDEVGKLQNTFADLTGVLKAKEQSERRLIASISHDIKTPLTSVLGYSERLLSAQLTQEKRERYLHSIYEKGMAIKSIVDEFDDYLDSGLRDEAPMELITAGSLCQGLRREYEQELLDAGVRLRVDCACPDAQLICNPAHMRRYFGNLIGNSIQHSGAQRLELDLSCRREGERMILEFWDNGQGVPAGQRSAIFEPLYTTDRGRKVSGLGLAICKSIITAHGGTISAHEGPRGGLLIWASLPCAPGPGR